MKDAIRLLAKVLFLIPQPCPSPNGEGLKRLSQEVYYFFNFLGLTTVNGLPTEKIKKIKY